jgi:diacylglycerol O-acyltransferase / wax synthase
MRQLNRHEAHFLYSDATHTNSNVTLIQIYDQSTAPGGKLRFKSVLAHVESRLHRSPIFRSKVMRVPLDVADPYWVEDENFDLEHHVRHIACPKPGNWRQFCIQASRIHARALDLNRPLWEIYVMEGLDSFVDLPPGSFALLIKVHHAAVGLEPGGDISQLLHDLSPGVLPPQPAPPWFPKPTPGALQLMWRGAGAVVRQPFQISPPLRRAVARLTPMAVNFLRDLLTDPAGMTTTRFNSVVSSHRVFDTRRFRLDQFKSIRRLVPGATVNDAAIAVCGGALRQYLAGKNELPASSLTAVAPVYVRQGPERDDAQAPRQVSWVRLALGTDIDDPVQRLQAIRLQTTTSSVMARAVRADELTDASRHAPAGTLALASKILAQAAIDVGSHMPMANCTVTNVPGPANPLYLLGARMTYFSAIMPITDGMGLVLAITSYDGWLVISPTSCRYLMPDPDVFTQCLRDSFQHYLALAEGLPPAPAARPRRPARPKSAAAGASAADKPVRASPRAKTASTAPRAAPGGRPRSKVPPG